MWLLTLLAATRFQIYGFTSLRFRTSLCEPASESAETGFFKSGTCHLGCAATNRRVRTSDDSSRQRPRNRGMKSFLSETGTSRQADAECWHRRFHDVHRRGQMAYVLRQIGFEQDWAHDILVSRAMSWLLELQSPQILPKRPAQVAALQSEFDGGLEEAKFVAGVVATALVDVGIHFFVLQERP